MTFMTWLGLVSVGLLVLCYGWPLWRRVLPAVIVGLFLYDVIAHDGGRWTFEALGAAIGIGFVGAAVLIVGVLPVTWALTALFAPREKKDDDPLSPANVERLLDDTLTGMMGGTREAPGGR